MVYGGAGGTLGPIITFAYRAGAAAAHRAGAAASGPEQAPGDPVAQVPASRATTGANSSMLRWATLT